MIPRWMRRMRASRRWRRLSRRLDPLRAVAFSLLLTAGLVAGRLDATPEPLPLAAIRVASPLKLAGAWVHAPKTITLHPRVELPAPAKPAWRLGMGRAPVGQPVEVSLTAYCLKGRTRRDNWVRHGIVAADPKLFPLARYLEIYVGKRYLGRFLIDDTGGAIRGNKIDIWTPECREAVLFGRRRGTAVLVPHGADSAPTPDVTRLMVMVRGR
jgi:3D (Asp-Asp-Asp) domain-containing protein